MRAWAVALAWLQAHTSHAATRPDLYEYLLVGVAAVAAAWTIYLAVRYTVRPGEDNPDHIKRRILEDAEDLAERIEDHLAIRKDRHG